LTIDAALRGPYIKGATREWKDATMLSFEAASTATDISNLVFIGLLLTVIVSGALGAYVASRRSR
jgi:hypothetical protein